ncbi:MAG: DUF4097 family beta strand repeat-containing protein [Chitinophagaceae bacterium]
MKNIKLFFSFSIAALLTLNSYAQDNKEQLVVPLSDPGKTYSLDVGLVSGSITIIGYDGKDILIDGKGDGDENQNENKNQNGMRRISSHNLSIVAEEKNNKVNVHTDRPNRTIRLTIKIPKGAGTIKLETVNDGDIEVSNTNGEMEISNTNGSIKLRDVSGSVVANSVNGDVTATFKSVDAQAAMAFSTLNGNVDVTFPASLKANVKLKSEQGDVFTDFDVVVDRTPPNAERTKEGNMYRLNIKDWIYGKIGGGGPEIMMNNMNGNIYARKSK